MSAMNRRDLLKLIGIGGVGAVATAVGGKGAEAAPVESSKMVEYRSIPFEIQYDKDLRATFCSGNLVPLGTASFDGREIPLYVEMTPEQLRRFADPFGGDE